MIRFSGVERVGGGGWMGEGGVLEMEKGVSLCFGRGRESKRESDREEQERSGEEGGKKEGEKVDQG